MQHGHNKIAVNTPLKRYSPLYTEAAVLQALPQDRGNLPDQNIPLLRGRNTFSAPALQPLPTGKKLTRFSAR